MTTTLIILSIILVAGLVGLIFFNRYQKKNLIKMFEQIQMASKQVPKQKKQGFLLLMFKEGLQSQKNKSKDFTSKFSNPKALEVQLVQMNKHIKNKDQVKDKLIKRSLNMLDSYNKWEKEKNKQSA